MQQVRTQIYLPSDLKQEIDHLRVRKGLSLGGYIREAAKAQIARDQKSKTDLKKLAEELGSGVKKSGWEGMGVKEVVAWQRRIRKNRKIF